MPNKEKKALVLKDGVARVTVSFYRYVLIKDPREFRARLLDAFSAVGALGRIYVAHEGINAQMSLPKDKWEVFDRFVQQQPELKGVPYKIAVEETGSPSFYKLTVKVREKIVADGLDDSSFDVTKTGEYLSAKEFNEYIYDKNTIIVDMRNGYESEIGHFERAITPDVDTFKEELRIVPELLRVHKNKKIALYCTGGIRCEKASAWLRHNGFTDVRHLRGGIIDYARQVKEERLPNHFKGKNFVFDERMGERIGDEIIATCHLCGKNKCDDFRHCNNQACHVLYIGCARCVIKKCGYCSYKCFLFDKLPSNIKKKLTRNNHTKKLEQFKKHRMKSVVR